MESLKLLENDSCLVNSNENSDDFIQDDMFANTFDEDYSSHNCDQVTAESSSDMVTLENNGTYLHNLQTSFDNGADITQLNVEQKAVFDYVMKNAHAQKQVHLFCTGPGGTGKSFLICCITQHLCLKYAKQHGVRPVVLAGSTGICSKNIHGVTLHSLLKLPIDSARRSHRALGSQALSDLCITFSAVSHLVIDEISMVSSQMLNHIHDQLCTIFSNNLPFGGFSILAFGDFYQLQPVKGSYAFANIMLWHLFEPFFLTQC